MFVSIYQNSAETCGQTKTWECCLSCTVLRGELPRAHKPRGIVPPGHKVEAWPDAQPGSNVWSMQKAPPTCRGTQRREGTWVSPISAYPTSLSQRWVNMLEGRFAVSVPAVPVTQHWKKSREDRSVQHMLFLPELRHYDLRRRSGEVVVWGDTVRMPSWKWVWGQI